MEQILGPTVSVLESGMNITGTAEDLLSGTVGYCYNQSDATDEFTPVEPVQTTSYTAPQFKITASGVWRFHAKDLAGNTNFKSTSSLTKYTYHCNWCGQDTNSLTNHYRCPVHYSSQSCSNYDTCSFGGTCGLALPPNGSDLQGGYGYTCFYCGTYMSGGLGSELLTWDGYCSRCAKHYNSSYNVTGVGSLYYWHTFHGNPPICNGSVDCGKNYTTNYSTN